MLSVSLSGFINYLNVDDPSKPLRIIKGHNKPITVLTLSPDRSTIYTGSHDGYITNWNAVTGENDRVQGQGHGNQINGMKAANNSLYTVGIDDTLRVVDIATNSYSESASVKLDSQPHGLDIYGDVVVVVSIKQVLKKLLYYLQSFLVLAKYLFLDLLKAMDQPDHVTKFL